MALVTLQEYKDYYDINSTDKDTRLQLIVDLVSDLVESYCGRVILSATYTDKKKEIIRTSIFLDNFPLTDVATVKYYSIVTGDLVTADTSDYIVYEDEGIIEFINGAVIAAFDSVRTKNSEVTYTGGYATTPADLKLAIFDLITYYNKREQSPQRSFNNQTVDTSKSFSGSEMPAHIKRVLALYRIYE